MTQTIHRPARGAVGAGLLDGKAILITGASSGIGAEAARVLAREGAAVVLGARSQDRLAELCDELRGGGADATHLAGDISSTCDVQRLIDAVLQRHGRLDGAFNNAGISQGGGALADVAEETFDRLVAVNLKGVWLAMRAQIRAMLAAGTKGAIVNTSSVGGLRINAIAPGTTDTPMIAAWKRRDPGIEERLNAATPLGRGAQPSEVAEAAAWLLSDRASYVNGAVLAVDGGMTA